MEKKEPKLVLAVEYDGTNVNSAELADAAKAIKIMYTSFIDAGFTDEQAMEFTKHSISLAMGLRDGRR